MAPQIFLNAGRQGHGSQQQQHRDEGIGQLVYWTCGEEHLIRRDCLQHQGGRPKIYSAQGE